jgi:hypothetical protein
MTSRRSRRCFVASERENLSAAVSRVAPYRSRTGITQAEYDRLLVEQGGHCALCPNTPKTRRLHVDHDHATGAVRGLLCFRCNRFLPSWVTRGWALRVAEYVS